MREILDSFASYLAENWPEILWIAAAAGVASYLGSRRARSRWRRRDFLDRLNVSLNSISEETLRIRTVLEMDVHEIILNAAAAKSLVRLAGQTTSDDPLIPIPKEDSWYFLNAVLNEISERFAVGHLRRDAGLPVTREDYLVCLTCERAGSMRTRKIRAMLIRTSLLQNLPVDEPQYESETHHTRWQTLQVLARRCQDSPHLFLTVELCL